MQAYVIWWLLGLVLLFSELMLPGLLLFFFGIGAMVTGLVCAVVGGIPLNLQILVFLVVSVGSLVGLRRGWQRVFRGVERNTADSPDEAFIGRNAVVTDAIQPGRPGRVEVNGTGWNAEAAESLPAGTPVRISDRRGLSLHVIRLEPHDTAFPSPVENHS